MRGNDRKREEYHMGIIVFLNNIVNPATMNYFELANVKDIV